MLRALDPQKAITQYKLDIWTTDRGFPQSVVSAITQTRDGYIWLGIQDGLVRFDGIRFKVFDTSNTHELKSNSIKALCEDRTGNLWIGTENGGLTRLKDGKFATFTLEECPGLHGIYTIVECREGTLWIGSTSKGLTRLKDGIHTTFTTKDGLPSNRVYAICEDKNGDLWVGTSAGLSKRKQAGAFTTYDDKTPLLKEFIYCIHETQNGDIWISAVSGLYRKTNQAITLYSAFGGILPGSKIITLYEDRHQSLWLGTEGDGLVRLRNGRIESFSPEKGMPDGLIRSICEDREGNLWIGTKVGGVLRLQDTPITMYTTREGLPHNFVYHLSKNRFGNIQVVTASGLCRITNGIINPEYKIPRSFFNQGVGLFIEDRYGSLWFNTSEGLHCLRNGEVVDFNKKSGISSQTISNLIEDGNGDIWIGTQNGLNRYHDGVFTVYNEPEGLIYHSVTSILEDRNANLWVGTENGLNKLKDGKFTPFTTKEGLVHNAVDCIYEDEEGVLFIGTREGLSRLENGKFTNFTTQNGLTGNRVIYILEDNADNLWLSGPSGLSRISKKELADVAAGRIDRIHPVTFTEKDGLKSRWCRTGAKDRDGRLWFATDKGLAMIDPANIKKNTLPPPVIIEELKVDGEPVDIHAKEELVLPPGVERLEFIYTGLSFLKPREMKFNIILEGYDNNWIDRGDARSIVYTHLSPGEYTFKVTAVNSDGITSQPGAALSFYLKPYFYQTYWFYILVVLFSVFAVFSGFRFRIRQLRTREKKLSALVSLRTQALNERTRQLEKANRTIEEKNRNITASITYARTIQQAILPADEKMKAVLKEYFILFEPRDIVSGDFYWFGQSGDKYFIAAVDCTGHGVPGAFLSMIGNMELDEILHEGPVRDPGRLLAQLNTRVRAALKQENGDTKGDDGMEISMCMIDHAGNKIIFAGARRPLFYFQKGKLHEIKGDRKSIGGRQKEKHRTFSNHEIRITGETTLYLTTDGFADQNNSEDEKYSTRRLKDFLQNNALLGMAQQKEALQKELASHRGKEEQRDDITIIGIRIRG